MAALVPTPTWTTPHSACLPPPFCSLHFLFDKHFAKAVQIVDHGGVFSYVGERSGRRVFQVQGHRSSERYTVVPRNYCSCHNFYFDIVSKQEAIYVRPRSPARPDWVLYTLQSECGRPPCPLTPRSSQTTLPPALQCKHQLAARLAEALGRTRTSTVSDLVVAELLRG